MRFTSYFELISRQPRLIGFGFAMALVSSFGQTYFVGIFGPEIQNEFNLSHTYWGTIYMVGTLASAALVPWTGSLIDRFSLQRYTLAVVVLLTIASVFISLTVGVLTLIIAIFLLRQSGQSLAMHISFTTMSRYFEADRGRAISLASMGATAGGALLPLAAVLGIAVVGWRWTYVGAAIVSGCFALPLILWLLKGQNQRHRAHLETLATMASDPSGKNRSWNRREVLRDRRFYLLLPGFVATDVIVTAMFFHHINLADAKGWSHAWVTGNYVIYSLVALVVTLWAGALIDRVRAAKLAPFVLLPIAAALLIPAFWDAPWTVVLYMILLGVNSGLAYPTMVALWPELYGVRHIGAVRSLAKPIALFGSALGPVIMGGLMDLGVSIEAVCLLFSGYCLLGTVSVFFAVRERPAALPKEQTPPHPP